MATNDFYKAIEALKYQQEIVRQEFIEKKKALDNEYNTKITQLLAAVELLYEVGNVCPECDGSGRVEKMECFDYDDRRTIVPCKKCKGTGTYIHEVKDV